jgi:perosamine synthetase
MVMYEIPLYKPSLDGNEKKYVNECLDSTWISSKGEFIPRFENHFAEYVGSRHAASVCNGTVALHVALLALGIGVGDEVIVPSLTYVASVNSIAYTGARPVFVDSLETSWQMDPEDVRRKISPKTRAIMVVHLYGLPCDMHTLSALAADHDLLLIEDCAEAIGSLYQGRHVGTFGNIATYSFYGNKTITTGEGGMVVTSDEALYERVVHLKGQGLAKNRHYWHDVTGYNYRMTNICAAIGFAQLERVDVFLSKKREIASWYELELENVPVTFHRENDGVRHSYWMCSILVNDPEARDSLRKILNEKGIETRPLFFPVHTMPMYVERGEVHPVAENLSLRGINLPSWPGLQKIHIEHICGIIRNSLGIRK